MRIMGLDYGSKTVGVAVCDPLGITAQAVETITRKDENKLRQTLARIEALAKEYGVEKFVLGYPKNMNNTIGDRAVKSLELKDVLERRRKCYAIVYRKAKSVCLSRSVVRILSYYHYLYLGIWAKIKCIEYKFSRRIDYGCLIFMANKIGQFNEIIFLKFWRQDLFPCSFYLYIHSCFSICPGKGSDFGRIYQLNKIHAQALAFFPHLFRPNAGLYFTDMGFFEI